MEPKSPSLLLCFEGLGNRPTTLMAKSVALPGAGGCVQSTADVKLVHTVNSSAKGRQRQKTEVWALMNSIPSCASTEMIVDAVQPTHPSYPTVQFPCVLCSFPIHHRLSSFLANGHLGTYAVCPEPRKRRAVGSSGKDKVVPFRKLVIAPSPQGISLPMAHAHAPLCLGITRPWRCVPGVIVPASSHFVSEGKMGRSMGGGKSFNNQSKPMRKQK